MIIEPLPRSQPSFLEIRNSSVVRGQVYGVRVRPSASLFFYVVAPGRTRACWNSEIRRYLGERVLSVSSNGSVLRGKVFGFRVRPGATLFFYEGPFTLDFTCSSRFGTPYRASLVFCLNSSTTNDGCDLVKIRAQWVCCGTFVSSFI